MAAGVYFPPVGFHFLVRFDFSDAEGAPQFLGKDVASPQDFRFQEVSGLAATIEYEDIMEGGENAVTYSLPKAVKHDKLILKRGMLLGSRVLKWVRDALENFKFTTCGVQVFLLNDLHVPVAAWQFSGVYPVGWNVSAFNAMENSYVVETLEMRYRDFKAITVTVDAKDDAAGGRPQINLNNFIAERKILCPSN